MNRDELREFLALHGVSPDLYSIEEPLRDNTLCLEHKESGGWLVYFLDRGLMGATQRFDTEDGACDYFAKKIVSDLRLGNA
jgi:hypothetical protein